MNEALFEALTNELRNGQNRLLDQLFVQHFEYCTDWLVKRYKCTKDDAQDIFMDALLIFRAEVVKGKITNAKYLRGYLVTVGQRLYLHRLRSAKTTITLEIEKVDYYIGQREGLYDTEFNPMLKAETESAMSKQEKQQTTAYRQAWQKLNEPCQKLLKGFYIDKIKLKDLQHQLGYSTYDTIRSIRRRCFNQLKTYAHELIGN